jgi:5-methylcytosine-specific restriction endonuclease McrA
MDAKGIDRTGKDIDHKKPLSKGGSNSMSNLILKSPSANRSFQRNSDRSVK